MQIVPQTDTLVVDAKVAPQDIDQIVSGAMVVVRVMAGNQRTMPDVNGELIRVSPDLTRDPPSGPQPGQAYYVVRTSLPGDTARNIGDLRLVPGMPAEALIQTNARTPLQYLLKPLHDQIARTFRER